MERNEKVRHGAKFQTEKKNKKILFYLFNYSEYI